MQQVIIALILRRMVNMSQIKRYRYFIEHKYVNVCRYNRVIIYRVPFGYLLRGISSAFNFSGVTTVRYGITMFSKSIFGFKDYLKKEGIIKNLVKENRETKKFIDAWPKNIRKAILGLDGKECRNNEP